MKRLTVLLIALTLSATQNPASFTCDVHYQTFVRSGTITQQGRCYEVYNHSYPAHRVLLPCQ